MRINQLFVAGLGACLVVTAGSVDAEGLKLGDNTPAAAVKMKNVDGREISIADAAGEKGTLVVFSCNHCPYVKAWESRLVEIGNTYQKKGVGVIVINPNDPSAYQADSFEAMEKQAKAKGYQFPYVVDGTSDVARAFGATRTPETFLFDKSGKLVYHGAIDDDADAKKVTKNYLRDALDALIDGKEIAVAETKFVGCGIKLRPKT